MQTEYWIEKFRQRGALWTYAGTGPHASYEMADRHSTFYLNTDIVVSDHELAAEVVEALGHFLGSSPVVNYWIATPVGTLPASLILATKLATYCGRPILALNLETTRFNVAPPAAANAIIVVDDVHSGGSVKKLRQHLLNAGVCIHPPLLAIGNFSGQDDLDGIPIQALVRADIPYWQERNCPMCGAGSPALAARQNWDALIEGR